MSVFPGAGMAAENQLDEEREPIRRAFRDELEYAQFVAQLRVLETRLLTRNQLLRMVEAPDAETAFRLLAETEYGPAVALAGTAFNYEVALAAELSRVFALLASRAPEAELVEVLGISYDWQNLKTALKAVLTSKEIEERHLVAAGNLSREAVLAIARGGAMSTLPAPYREPALQAARAFGASGDPQEIDLILDAARFPSIIKRAQAWGYDLFSGIASTTADLVNLRTLLRLKALQASGEALERALVPGGQIPLPKLASAFALDPEEMVQALSGYPVSDVFAAGVNALRNTGSLALYEKLMDDRLLSMTAAARYIALGPEPVIAYLMAKETEIKNLRIVFTGKINRLPENTIRERLRETYA